MYQVKVLFWATPFCALVFVPYVDWAGTTRLLSRVYFIYLCIDLPSFCEEILVFVLKPVCIVTLSWD